MYQGEKWLSPVLRKHTLLFWGSWGEGLKEVFRHTKINQKFKLKKEDTVYKKVVKDEICKNYQCKIIIDNVVRNLMILLNT